MLVNLFVQRVWIEGVGIINQASNSRSLTRFGNRVYKMNFYCKENTEESELVFKVN